MHIPKKSSFEEATKIQNEEAISALQRQRSKDPEPIAESELRSETKNVSTLNNAIIPSADNGSSFAFASASTSSASLIYENQQVESTHTVDAEKLSEITPAIEIEYASDGEEYIMEGISDFYDFNASIHPSRSRSRTRSRSKSPMSIKRSVSPHRHHTLSRSKSPKTPATNPSPNPAPSKFIYQGILPNGTDDRFKESRSIFLPLSDQSLLKDQGNHPRQVHQTQLVTNDGFNQDILKLRRTPTTPDYDRSISEEWKDVQKLKEELLSGSFKRSTYVGESMDFSDQFESLRAEAKLFRRSRSKSRSPGYDIEALKSKLLDKKNIQEKILQDITNTSANCEDFSNDMTISYVDRNRRASDTALIQKPEILFQIQDLIEEHDDDPDILDLEEDEYHHFRRFSLNQETQIEQYPDDFICISESEIRSLTDIRKLPEDNSYKLMNSHAEMHDSYDSGSEDERQTVVEVDDEIDEDICDFNEHPEEYLTEQSECEEADREIDHYANKQADDWTDVDGAVGGMTDDEAAQIEQIYDEAIKNRKQSGILRDYDTILKEIQISDISDDSFDSRNEDQHLAVESVSTNGSPRNRLRRAGSGESSSSFLEFERRDNEHRYLGDATMSAINSTRLRSRYGIVPSTSFTTTYDNITDVDVNYVPKKEYNWRKNFKLDDDESKDGDSATPQFLDTRKFSLGGESITLFSQSPDRRIDDDGLSGNVEESNEMGVELKDKIVAGETDLENVTKMKKTKRKVRKGSKGSFDDIEPIAGSLSRKNSISTEESEPKKKARRASKVHLDTEAALENSENEEPQTKKKLKKKKKVVQELSLPKLVPLTTEKKQAPPSVAALRAALTSSSSEVKPNELRPRESRKIPVVLTPPAPKIDPLINPVDISKNTEVVVNIPSPISPQKEYTPSNMNSPSVSAASNAPLTKVAPVKSTTPPTSVTPPSTTTTITISKTTSQKPEAYDIIKDGGLYPLF